MGGGYGHRSYNILPMRRRYNRDKHWYGETGGGPRSFKKADNLMRRSAVMAKCGLLAGCALLCLVVEVGAGAWTLPQKKLWGKVTHFQQTTNEWFVASPQFVDGQVVSTGQRAHYNFNGQCESKALFSEGFYGVSDRFDVAVQIPYFDQSFADETHSDPVSDVGLSDMRLFAKFRLVDTRSIFA